MQRILYLKIRGNVEISDLFWMSYGEKIGCDGLSLKQKSKV